MTDRTVDARARGRLAREEYARRARRVGDLVADAAAAAEVLTALDQKLNAEIAALREKHEAAIARVEKRFASKAASIESERDAAIRSLAADNLARAEIADMTGVPLRVVTAALKASTDSIALPVEAQAELVAAVE